MHTVGRRGVVATLVGLCGCSASDSSAEWPTEPSPTPERLERPDVRRAFGDRYVDDRTGVAFTLQRPRTTATLQVAGETFDPSTYLFFFAPVTFHNTAGEPRLVYGDVFRLVANGRVIPETDDVIGYDVDSLNSVEQERRWASNGTQLDPGEQLDGVAAFQLEEQDRFVPTVVLDLGRLYREQGEHTLVGWSIPESNG